MSSHNVRVHTRLALPDGRIVTAGHGAIIGRLSHATVHIADPRISEAHALISLRGRDLKLLSLRGRFVVAGRTLAEAILTPGLEVTLAPDLVVRVLSVQLPEHVMALEGPFGRQVLLGPTSVFDQPPRLEYGARPQALAVVWPLDGQWVLADGTPLTAGDVLSLGPFDVHAVTEAVAPASPTVRSENFDAPLCVRVRFDSVHVQREGAPTLVLNGIIARVITDVAQSGGPVGWESLARSIWPALNPDTLRRRWDMQLVRLRAKLRDHGIRTDLLRADGLGLLELVLHADDELIDEA
ncbi:MAG: hypothetical protein AAFV53_21755 [Myxococcota bacterium]